VTERLRLKLFLDEGVPRSVGRAFEAAGHEVLYLQQTMATGSPDTLVCAVAEVNEAILVAIDADMKKLASRHGVGARRYKSLSLIKLSCKEPRAAARVQAAMSLIEHEWNYSQDVRDRRLFVEIGDSSIRTNR
jgi:predicted nuclease of predicted toxin-antitoxin system